MVNGDKAKHDDSPHARVRLQKFVVRVISDIHGKYRYTTYKVENQKSIFAYVYTKPSIDKFYY